MSRLSVKRLVRLSMRVILYQGRGIRYDSLKCKKARTLEYEGDPILG